MSDLKELLSVYLKSINHDAILQTYEQSNITALPLNLTSIHNHSPTLFTLLVKNFKKTLEVISTLTPLSPLFYKNPISFTFRDLKVERLYQLTTFSAIVTRTSPVRPELSIATFECRECKCKTLNVVQKNKYTPPLICSNHLCKNRVRFTVLPRESLFYDWQKINCQEVSEETPAGTLPRSLAVFCRGEICEKVKPGDHVRVTGHLSVLGDDYVNLIGITSVGGGDETRKGEKINVKECSFKFGFFANNFEYNVMNKDGENENELLNTEGDVGVRMEITDTPMPKILKSSLVTPENKENINREIPLENFMMSSQTEKMRIINYIRSSSNTFVKLSESLFPYINGHSAIKQAILLMLAGGNTKEKDGMRLRGDINILLVGDPGTAKSQFLKNTAEVLPRSIFTSGKSSSAAGLTACVIKDIEGDYTIEAGALMLSDSGVCCIDEFDKMKNSDRVSIHEAMEQQTITINKAGINATLNARCSILAAANPINGRYDESKTLKGNINLSDPIMSRFDLYFVLIDSVDKDNDTKIAVQILENHTLDDNSEFYIDKMFFTLEEIRIYLMHVRQNISPTISKEVGKSIVEKYITLRQNSAMDPGSYKITVRQLESLIRISEAIAKIHYDTEVRLSYVEEAFRLIQGSVIEIKTSDVSLKLDVKESKESVNGVVYVSKKEYMRVVSSFIYILKTTENVTKENLLCDYLEMREKHIESAEGFKKEEETGKYVLEHLLHKENVLYEIDDHIFIHPNYDA